MSRVRGGVRFLIFGMVWILGLWLLAYAMGLVVRLVPRTGSPTDSRLSFAEVGEPELLVQDFPPASEVRNVVLLIADGMGFSHLAGARAALVGPNGRLHLERMPITGWLTTHSASQLYTDSAAGATALATGVKTQPGALAITPAGTPVTTLAEAARDAGKAVGLITDSYLWDATPAAFIAHQESRRDYSAIARAMARSGFELLIGEEHPHHPEDDRNENPFLAEFVEHGYRLSRTLAELEGGTLPALGLLPTGVIADGAEVPSLEDLTTLALERLAADPEGFFLLIETEESDSGSHNGDFDRMVRGIGALDRACQRVLDFARRDRHTLVIATADHETGGLAVLLGREGEPLRVRWGTRSHTAEPVPLLAYGPGAETLGGARDNTAITGVVARLMGLDWSR